MWDETRIKLIEKRLDALEFCPVMPFGKHKGSPIRSLSESYVTWLFEKSEILQNPDNISLRKDIERVFPSIAKRFSESPLKDEDINVDF